MADSDYIVQRRVQEVSIKTIIWVGLTPEKLERCGYLPEVDYRFEKNQGGSFEEEGLTFDFLTNFQSDKVGLGVIFFSCKLEDGVSEINLHDLQLHDLQRQAEELLPKVRSVFRVKLGISCEPEVLVQIKCKIK